MSGLLGRGWLAGMAGEEEIAERLGEPRQIADMLTVELAYTRAAGAAGKVPQDMAARAAEALAAVNIDSASLAKAAAKDGVPVPGLVRQIRAQLDEALHPAIHAGMTSQDVTDNAMSLALRDILEILERRLHALETALAGLSERFGDREMMGRTRMQAALGVTVAHRVAQWTSPISGHLARLEQVRSRLLKLQLGGPVGTRASLGERAGDIATAMAGELGLQPADAAWHTDRSGLADLAGWLSGVSGTLGKMGQDLCLMSQQGVDAVQLSGGGSSSAMAHKVNPVRAELLVALARFNAVQLSGMHLALEHEQERSGTSWTLEWLVLPQMLVATGGGLRLAESLTGDIEEMGDTPGGESVS